VGNNRKKKNSIPCILQGQERKKPLDFYNEYKDVGGVKKRIRRE
jgi:hypothetical protein